MNPTQRVEAVRTAKTKVLEHCMCTHLEETPHHYQVQYPPGCHPLFDGCRVSKGMGQLKALVVLHDKMETHYQEGLL